MKSAKDIPKCALWRGVVKSMLALKHIYWDTVEAKKKQREDQMAFLEKFIKIYQQVARGWIRKAVRKPLITIMGDKEQALAFDKKTLGDLGFLVDA